jgi:hypothetical protein
MQITFIRLRPSDASHWIEVEISAVSVDFHIEPVVHFDSFVNMHAALDLHSFLSVQIKLSAEYLLQLIHARVI